MSLLLPTTIVLFAPLVKGKAVQPHVNIQFRPQGLRRELASFVRSVCTNSRAPRCLVPYRGVWPLILVVYWQSFEAKGGFFLEHISHFLLSLRPGRSYPEWQHSLIPSYSSCENGLSTRRISPTPVAHLLRLVGTGGMR